MHPLHIISFLLIGLALFFHDTQQPFVSSDFVANLHFS